ncbi:MAG TPA: hypothetical protein PKC28_09955 [Bdellovibrionales bacterium]|nr:hypothetical protein [Bdellovibrionales bacterium]
MNWIAQFILTFFVGRVKARFMSEAKRRGVVLYLRALNGTRRGIILALLGAILLQAMVLAGFGMMITGVLLLDYDFVLRLEILFGIFVGMFTLPALVLTVVLSERAWYKASGAERMIDDLRDSA